MRLLRGLHNPGLQTAGCVATIGNFDGVHLGHQAILARVNECARKFALPSVAVVFEPQPQEYFNPDQAPARLMTLREKLGVMAEGGMDYVFCLRFDRSLSLFSADRFVDEVLVQHLGIKHLIVGDDFRFGGDREGDYSHLQARGKDCGFSVENTDSLRDEQTGLRISSTHVREALKAGNFTLAARMLGRSYSMSGRVIHGQALGRGLGFPTANLPLRRLHTPLHGVYVVRLRRASGEWLSGVANIGSKPSVGQFQPSLEVHLFDFSGDLYGERVLVEFIAHLRDEQRFDGLAALKAQIGQDVEQAKAILIKYNNSNGH